MMRNPFRKKSSERGIPVDALAFDVDKGRERYLERLPDHEISKVEADILYNAVVIETGIPSKQLEDSQPETENPGKYVLFMIDEDGFLMDQNREYLLPSELRCGRAFVSFVGAGPHGEDIVEIVDKAELEKQTDN